MSDDAPTTGPHRVVYRYDARKNRAGSALDGVPLRDLTAADLESLPAWLQASVADTPFYIAISSPPRRRAAAGAADDDEGAASDSPR